MLIIPQGYNKSKEDVLENPDEINNIYFALTDITGKQIFVIGLDPDIYKKCFCICIGDFVSAESNTKYDVFESEGNNVSEDEAIKVGAYEKLSEALDVLDNIIESIQRGEKVFRMP